MNEFLLKQGRCDELEIFPHIIEFGIVKNPSIRLNAFHKSSVPGIKLFYILDGTFQWKIDEGQFTLYPGDVALVLPGQEFGSYKDMFEIGSFFCLHIEARQLDTGEIVLGRWSNLSDSETMSVSKILLLNSPVVILKFPEAGRILKCMQQELVNRELGHRVRVNNQIDELLIVTTRQRSRESDTGRDFSKTFTKLEEALRKDLSHQWTVEEMAAFVGLGTTLFNEKVKSYSGFSPLNYLIKIRISEAIKLLKKEKANITDIALETGFSSSQHFSTTFKKLTGYTPKEFRKKNNSND
ncbi:MAG: AraC family transcriptional regulator [Bacteroidota bacterium]